MDGKARALLIVIVFVTGTGCTQLPGLHTIGDTPDPVIGQWIGGEPPASDLHVIFYDNRSYSIQNFYLNRKPETDSGYWTRAEGDRYELHSVTGTVSRWIHDTSDDTLYDTAIPLKKYSRYRG